MDSILERVRTALQLKIIQHYSQGRIHNALRLFHQNIHPKTTWLATIKRRIKCFCATFFYPAQVTVQNKFNLVVDNVNKREKPNASYY
jgi:hypothetical protein